MATTVETEIGGRRLILETGLMAKQASGAVVARYGDTVVLSTAVASKVERENVDFLPLTVDYQEKAYAAGRIPGGFFKREGRQSEKEILTSRLIDRPIRPLFPDGYYFDTQIIASVLSIGDESSMDLMGMVASSAALAISDIPFRGPIGAVRIGLVDGKFVINPGHKDLETTKLNLVVAGTADAIMMVEGGANELTEDQMLEALETAHREIKKIVALQKELVAKVGKPKRSGQGRGDRQGTCRSRWRTGHGPADARRSSSRTRWSARRRWMLSWPTSRKSSRTTIRPEAGRYHHIL